MLKMMQNRWNFAEDIIKVCICFLFNVIAIYEKKEIVKWFQIFIFMGPAFNNI